MLPVTIRRAELADAPAIADIYNEAILTTTATFDTETKSVEERAQWLQSHDERHPVLVAVVDGRVVGWASLTRWSERRAYDDTAETSFYVHSTHRRRGIGASSRMRLSRRHDGCGIIRSSPAWPRGARRVFISMSAQALFMWAHSKRSDASSTDFWMFTSCRRCWIEHETQTT